MILVARTIAVFLIFAVSLAFAAKWPEGYIFQEECKSLDGQYGIIVPNEEDVETDGEYSVNYLANINTHQVLGKIEGADYFEGQNLAVCAVPGTLRFARK